LFLPGKQGCADASISSHIDQVGCVYVDETINCFYIQVTAAVFSAVMVIDKQF